MSDWTRPTYMHMKISRIRRPEFWISVSGLFCLTATFLQWQANCEGLGEPEIISAVASAVLLAVLYLRFVPYWMDFWRRDSFSLPPAMEAEKESIEPKHMEIKIFAACMLLSGAVVLLVYCLRLVFGYDATFRESLEFWRCTDSAHYLDIARDWYLSEGDWGRLVQLVFLPGYPLVVRLVNCIAGNYLYSGMIVSALSFAGAGSVFYRLLRLDYSHKDSVRAVRFLCILPGAFFFTAPMSESLFLLLCVGCIYCVRTGKWLCGCALGALAAFTRSLGLVLCVPLFFELVSGAVRRWNCTTVSKSAKQIVLRFAGILLIPVGFGVYCTINYVVSGNFFQFMEYQSTHWGQNLGWFFNTAAYQMKNAISCWTTNQPHFFGLWLPNLMVGFLSLAIMILSVKKLQPSYIAWFLVYYIIAMGATWLLSAPRYLVSLLPVPLAVSQLTKNPVVDKILTVVCLILYLLYLCAFVLRWQVW